MLQKIKGNSLLLLIFILCAHCTHTDKLTADKSTSIEMDKPLIQNLTTAQPQLQNLKYSLVRLHVEDKQNQSSFGTGFFFKTRELLVTTLHTFDKNPCLEKSWCPVKLGFAKDEKDINEIAIEARVVLRDRDRDLLFLEVKQDERFASVQP